MPRSKEPGSPVSGQSGPPKADGGRLCQVPEALGGRRLDAAVKTLLGASWNQARSWIRLGKVSLNGVTVTDGAHAVAAGDALCHDATARRLHPETDLPPEVLVFVDRHLVVADKPAGISTVPFEELEAGAMTSRLRALLGHRRGSGGEHRSASGGERRRGVPPPVIAVHRLDRDTSGLVVFARQQAAVEPLSAQFRAHEVHRRYLALVHGYASGATYRSHLLEDRGDGRRGSLEQLPPYRRKGKGPGRLAITHTEVVERLGEATLLLCRLETGRTHQIRIHLAEAGHPLVGERVYMHYSMVETLTSRIPAPRMMLHAAELGFLHPITGAPLRFERPPPADMQELIARLRALRPTPAPAPKPEPVAERPSKAPRAAQKQNRPERRPPARSTPRDRQEQASPGGRASRPHASSKPPARPPAKPPARPPARPPAKPPAKPPARPSNRPPVKKRR